MAVSNIPDKFPKLPTLRGLRNWIYDLIFLALIVAGIFYFVAAVGEGGTFWERLGDVYQTLIDATTDGEKWTDIMRENHLYLIAPGAAVLVLLGWILPRTYTGRAIFLFVTFSIGVVFGHVFW